MQQTPLYEIISNKKNSAREKKNSFKNLIVDSDKT